MQGSTDELDSDGLISSHRFDRLEETDHLQLPASPPDMVPAPAFYTVSEPSLFAIARSRVVGPSIFLLV